jgi:cobalt-precorrin 5A hydrolase
MMREQASAPTLALGIGCRRGASADEIEAAVAVALAALDSRSLADVRVVASIESKAGEAGLVEFCARHGLPLRSYRADRLADAATPPSAVVTKHLGIGGVCEPCALAASHDGRLAVPKTVVGNVTVAIASDRLYIIYSKSHA